MIGIMKKKYQIPSVTTDYAIPINPLLTQSNSITSEVGITYGGVSDGTLTPEVKRYSVWEDDWSDGEDE